MNYKKLISQSFSKVVPSKNSEEIMKSVFERTEKMKAEKENKKTARKPFAAAIAAAAAITLGVTGAAAAGIISFNDIFGSKINAETEYSYLLMGRAENVKASASDEDYNVSLLGVTGGNDCAIMSIEISRRDGKPVTDYFLNRNDDSTLMGIISSECGWENPDADSRQYSYTQINEAGNILVSAELSVEFDHIEDTSLAGEKITVSGDSFYPSDDFFSYIDEIGAKRSDSGASYADGTPADLSSVVSLPLEWSISFDYFPSEKASEKLHIKENDLNRAVTLKRTKNYTVNPSSDEIEEYTVEVRDIEIGCTMGFIELKEYQESVSEGFPQDEILLITKDGKEINTQFNGGLSYGYDGYAVSRNKLEYYSESAEQGYCRFAVDVSEIAAISINGERFELAAE